MHCKNHMTQQIKKQSFKSLELEIHNLSASDVPNIQSINKWNEMLIVLQTTDCVTQRLGILPATHQSCSV